MLTVDFDRLGLHAGEVVVDIGAGGGRHAFEALRRGALVAAVDVAWDELVTCRGTFVAMATDGEAPPGGAAVAAAASVLALPFRDGSVDRIVAAEVLEHVRDDRAALAELFRVLRPGGSLAVTVPAFVAETVCWRLDRRYRYPASPRGHVRIYSATVLRARVADAGFVPGASHHAHGLHTPYWWLRCAVGIERENHPVVQAYHQMLVKDIVEGPRLTRLADSVLSPVIGKSLVLYAHKPVRPVGTGAA